MPNWDTPARWFAPAERASAEEVEGRASAIRTMSLVLEMLEAFPCPAAILDQTRQICAANTSLLRLAGLTAEDILALRPGEAVCCVHAFETPSGCGTSPACANCGAVAAILKAQLTERADCRDCRVTLRRGSETLALDLQVQATPLDIAGARHIVLAIQDVTDERRRHVLERLFFHDVLNSAGGLRGLLEIGRDIEGTDAERVRTFALAMAEQIIEQIEAQRDLTAAEHGDLKVRVVTMDVSEFLTEIRALHESIASAEGKLLRVLPPHGDRLFRSDPILLGRVLGNLLRNAIEASQSGEAVTLGFENHGRPVFTVHNESVMPEKVKLQIFQRSFTTKKECGHGIGTYSVKLLTERYLRGEVTFRSEPGDGTAFYVSLPPSAAPSPDDPPDDQR